VVERRCSLLRSFDSPREEEKREDTCRKGKRLTHTFLSTAQEVRHFVQNGHPNPPDHVPHEQEEGVPSRGAEVLPVDSHHDVGVPVQELDALLQTPEAALHAAQQEFSTFILQNDPDDLDQRQDQRAKSQGAGVVPTQQTEASISPPNPRRPLGLNGNIHFIGHLAQGRDEIGAPEEEEEVVELEHDPVSVVDGLTAVEGKQALCVRTLSGGVGGVEGLRTKRGDAATAETQEQFSPKEALPGGHRSGR
uniref:Uncharacterized protein n=1 Tax=Oryzias latipes TaxID=8090 RepID=A0A3P9JPA1_ORYLA